MSDETIVAVYDTAAHADAAVKSLLAANVPSDSISQHSGAATGTASGTTAMPVQDRGFWSSLFGGEPEHDTAVYARSLEGGSVVVAVRAASEAEATRITDVLEQHSPIDLDARASGYGLATAPAPTVGTAPLTGESLQLSEESRVVGKRLVNLGGTRIGR